MRIHLAATSALLVSVLLAGCGTPDRGGAQRPKAGPTEHARGALPDGIYLVASGDPGAGASTDAGGTASSDAATRAASNGGGRATSDAGETAGGRTAPPPVVRVIPYNHAFLDPAADEPDSIAIVPSEFVLLELDREPEGVEREGEHLTLLLSMTRLATDQLAEFTGKHLGERVAIVIGGQAVTQHKVRARIEGGKLQVTRCDDDACRSLLIELKDNVKRD